MSTDSIDWIPQAGDLVVVRDPNNFVADLRNKIRNVRHLERAPLQVT